MRIVKWAILSTWAKLIVHFWIWGIRELGTWGIRDNWFCLKCNYTNNFAYLLIELKLSESLHQSLTKQAKNSGISTEALAESLLMEAAKSFNDDPLEKFIGAFDSKGSDWADQHDQYIGQEAIEDSHNKHNES